MAYVTQQIIKTTEGWATFDALGKPVPKDYWLFERVTETVGDVTKKYYKFKISDGVSLFADLPYQLLNGHSASINEAGNWLVYDDATQTYKDSGVKAVGVDGKSAFELWQALEGNADKTLIDFFVYLKGEKGDAFTFDDFTIEQLALLKGASAYQVWKAQPGNEDKTVEEYLLSIKGAPFTYADFTPEQIIAITGKSAYQIWLDQPGNEGKTMEEYLIAIKGQDGQSAYLDAVAKGYTGTKDEFDTLLASLNTPKSSYLDLSPLMQNDSQEFITTDEFIAAATEAYGNKVTTGLSDGKLFQSFIEFTSETWMVITLYNLSFSGPASTMENNTVITNVCRWDINITTKAVRMSLGMHAAQANGDGTKALMDDGTYKPVISPTDIETLTSLSSLSKTKYSQKYTYTTTTAQGINFASAPAEGFECLVSIKNGTSSQITQAIPNAAAWQCEETSLVIPAGKIGFISIQYIHGIYCVRVGL